jgi:hypothetical protein
VRTKPCSTAISQGRFDKANQFITAAGHTPATNDEVKKANRAAEALMEKARRVRGPANV